MPMGPNSPKDAVGQLVNALNSGNLDAAVSLYEPNAVLVAQPGIVARGTTALRGALSAFIALKPTPVTRRVLVFEEVWVGLFTIDWTLTGTDLTGMSLEVLGRSCEVVRGRPGGRWLIAVDDLC